MTAAVGAGPATVRAMQWGPLAFACCGVVALTAAQRPWDGGSLTLGFTRLAVALLAAAAAFALDDEAAETVAASPTVRWQRQWVRGATATLAVAAVSSLTSAVLALSEGAKGVPVARAVVEGAGLILLSFACAAIAGADRGPIVFLAGLLFAGMVQQRWPDYSLFPLGPGAPGWSAGAVVWPLIAVCAFAVVAVRWRDPAGRRRRGDDRGGAGWLRLPA